MFRNDAVTISNTLRVLAESIGKCRKGKGRIAEIRLKAENEYASLCWEKLKQDSIGWTVDGLHIGGLVTSRKRTYVKSEQDIQEIQITRIDPITYLFVT